MVAKLSPSTISKPMENKSGSASKKFHFVYKTTCSINGFIYIGVRSTDDLDDGYIGSGGKFRKAVKLLGKENFTREILEFFNTRDDAEDREAQLVDREFLKRKDIYNKIPGGGKRNTLGMVPIKDKDGNTDLVSVDDPRYISGELVPIATGMVTVKDKDGNRFSVMRDDQRYLDRSLTPLTLGLIKVIGILGTKFYVKPDDARIATGELTPVKKIKLPKICTTYQWISNVNLRLNRRVPDDLEPAEGWVKGRSVWNKKVKATVDRADIARRKSIAGKKRFSNPTERLKISTATKGRIHIGHTRNNGNKNPAYGLKFRWINDGKRNRKLLEGEQVPEGFSFGKIFKLKNEGL